MSWLTPQDLESRLSQADLAALTTGRGRGEEADQVILQGVLDRAEAEVRGVLAGRAVLPDQLEPGLLADITLDLAVEGLFLRQPGAAAKVPEGWQGRIKRARVLLDQMVSGAIQVPLPASSTVNRIALISPPSPVDGAFR